MDYSNMIGKKNKQKFDRSGRQINDSSNIGYQKRQDNLSRASSGSSPRSYSRPQTSTPRSPERKLRPDPMPFPDNAKKIDWDGDQNETTIRFNSNKKTTVRKW